jgi:hypothetical protein
MDNSKSKTVNEILQTKDYSIFKFHHENRTIIPSHVESLYKSMLVNGWLRGSYIVVDKFGNIMDGQHRLQAAVKANVPVNYVVEKKCTTDDISLLNTNTKNWNIINHLEKFVKIGNQNYVLLDRFMKNFPTFRPTECTMLVNNNSSSAKRGEFERGEFVVRDMKVAYDWGHKIMSLKPYFENGYNKSIFVRGMVKVLQNKNFNFDEFLHKVKLRPKSIVMCGTVEQYVEMIEEIYNYKRKVDEKVNLRFP